MRRKRRLLGLFLVFCLFLLVSCKQSSAPLEQEPVTGEPRPTGTKAAPLDEKTAAILIGTKHGTAQPAPQSGHQSEPAAAPAPAAPGPHDAYKVVLAADPSITMPGPPGRLKVWIGVPGYKPNFPGGMTEAVGTIPIEAVTAMIKPLAPAFKVDPPSSVCMKIDPTGSEVSFTLTPTRGGIFVVSADVHLFKSGDCSGIPIPKGTASLQIQVVVKHMTPFVDVFWDKLLAFWTEILVLVFAVILFLLRKQLRKWTGFGKEPKDKE